MLDRILNTPKLVGEIRRLRELESAWLLLDELTLSWRRFLSYRDQSIDLRGKSMDWFLYDKDLCHEKVNARSYYSNHKQAGDMNSHRLSP